jgi:tRNA pseudouridine55 synthase
MNGVLVIDKPAGPTSFDVVRRVRSLLHLKKVGHTGTLDPLATGVLPLCLGEATKIAGFITEGDKAYTAVIRLGVETDTQDAQGKVVSERPVPALGREALEAAVAGFRGKQLQTPPMYSAIKVSGRRLYELARAGEEVERAPREVVVHALLLVDFSERELTLEVRCSKGFFVRTLAADLGQELGCGAHLKALRRTQSGPFTLQQAVALDRLAADLEKGGGEALAQVERRLVSVSDALGELPAFPVSPSLAGKVVHGLPIEVPPRVPEGRIRVVDASGGRLLAVAEVGPTRRLRYLRVLS